jgi:hypothetical protein
MLQELKFTGKEQSQVKFVNNNKIIKLLPKRDSIQHCKWKGKENVEIMSSDRINKQVTKVLKK